ncbi:MAG: hypothetical protein N3A58_07020 [Spirochaetes bacterium]|nr:hypothetical protein [Spirochaetota bacterium]
MQNNKITIKEQNYSIEFSDNIIKIFGVVEIKNPNDNFSLHIKKINSLILERNLKEIIFDLTNLEFMNSSGIKVLVEWILRLEELPDDQRFKILFIYNPKILWQESTINTLLFLNEKLLSKKSIDENNF